MPEQGDIVLIAVPFTDLYSQKQRPVIVISNAVYIRQTEDIVVVAMTSNPADAAYSFPITTSDLQSGVLNRPGRVRADKVYTLSQSIIRRTFGRVKPEIVDRIRAAIDELTRPEIIWNQNMPNPRRRLKAALAASSTDRCPDGCAATRALFPAAIEAELDGAPPDADLYARLDRCLDCAREYIAALDLAFRLENMPLRPADAPSLTPPPALGRADRRATDRTRRVAEDPASYTPPSNTETPDSPQ